MPLRHRINEFAQPIARMQAAAELRVPLVVDTGVGADWDEAH